MSAPAIHASRVAIVAILAIVSGGCSDDSPAASDPDVTGGESVPTLPFSSPSKDELGETAGLAFPPSVTDYRSTSFGPSQLHVTFVMDNDDVDAFVDGSGLGPLDEGTLISHTSPLWETADAQNITGSVTMSGEFGRVIELVEGDGSTTVRLVVSPGG